MKLFLAILLWFLLLDVAWAHDIYHHLTGGTACRCGEERLCEAVEAIPVGKNKYYLPASGETVSAHITPSPDDRFHRCTYPLNMGWHPRYGVPAYPGAQYESGGKMLETQGPEGWIVLPDNSTKDGKPKTRCFFAPRVIS